MAIQRQPHNPMFRILDGSAELMRFRARNNGAAQAEARRQTAVWRKQDPSKRYGLERHAGGLWIAVAMIETKEAGA
jgi:hypothetical protein